MSLSLFAETIEHDLIHPITKELTGLTLILVGTDHDDVYEAQLAVVKSLSKKGVKELADFAMALEGKIKVAAACIVGWEVKGEAEVASWLEVFKKLGFEDLTFSPEKAVALLSMKTAGWIRTQIDDAIKDRNSFFKEASKV